MLYYSVEVGRLDGILEPFRGRTIDWLLIDAEGSELAVLAGATEALRRATRLIVEVSDPEAQSSGLGALIRSAGMTLGEKVRQGPRTEYWFFHRPAGPSGAT
jgi:hypothetical protein